MARRSGFRMLLHPPDERWRSRNAVANYDEQTLIRDAVAGDGVALKLLIVESHNRLRDHLASKIPPSLLRFLDVDDILQETHIEVFRHINEFKPQGRDSFYRWVATIALNRLRNTIKRHHRAKRDVGRLVSGRGRHSIEESSIALIEMVAGTGTTPSRSIMRREAVAAVQNALEEIPVQYQQAIRMVYLEGLPVAEVAKRLVCTKRAVHGLCRRGLQQLRDRLPSATILFPTSS